MRLTVSLTLPVLLLAAPAIAQTPAITQDPLAAGAEGTGGSVEQLLTQPDPLGTALDPFSQVALPAGGINPPFNPNAPGPFAGGNIFEGMVGNFGDFVSGLPAAASSLLEGLLGRLGLPDFQQVDHQVEVGRTAADNAPAATALAQALEAPNGQRGQGYNVGRDQSHEAQRQSAIGLAQSSVFGDDAQSQLAQRAQQNQATVQGSVALGDASQSSDVSQDILRNTSAQLALSAQLAGEQLTEAQQARIDRAMGNLLSAQQARALEQQVTLERRQRLATGNESIRQGGLLALPGGFYLGAQFGEIPQATGGNPQRPQQ